MSLILDGKTLGQKIRADLKQQVDGLTVKPGLAVVLIGDDPASQVYVGSKVKACSEIGYYSEKIILPNNVEEQEIFRVLDRLNNDNKIHGILVQFPLPKNLSYLEDKIINFLNPDKDVDCFHPINIGKLFIAKKPDETMLLPCTPKGIIRLLKEYKITMKGKNAVICGRSNLVGKPIALLLCLEGATITIAHSQTANFLDVTRSADILVAAIGKDRLIKSDGIKDQAVVIDVGINRVDKKIYGDVDFESVKDKVSAITPVPGGVGPMTIAMLMENVYLAYKNQVKV